MNNSTLLAMKSFKTLLFLSFFSFTALGWGQTTVFTETMGTVSGTTTIAVHEAANGFDNDAYTMSSGGATNPGDIRNSSASSGYTGASGLANVWLTSTNAAYGFAIEGIDASTYTSLKVQFGYRKESASALPTLALDYWNGTSYVNIPFTFSQAANASVAWYLSPEISLPVGAQISTLKLRFVKTGTVAVRIDDLKLVGTIGADTTSPTISTLNPINTATGVSITSNLVATFSENIVKGTGNILIKRFDDNSTVETIDVTSGVVTASGTTATINPTDFLSNTQYYIEIPNTAFKDASDNFYAGMSGNSNWSFTTIALTPEINVKQATTSIAHNGTYTFANTPLGANTDVIFTIENTGSSNLTFTTPLSASGDYSIISQPTSPVTSGSSTSFTVRFTPTAVGSRTGSVIITSTNDSDEPNYTINFSGVGTASNLSDVIANATYSYNSNISYADYQITTITNTSNSIDLFKFDIRDGGATTDADVLPTILNSITFNITNLANIRTAALFNGNALVSASPIINTGGGTIAFSGLSGANVTALDGGTNSLTLRVSFNTTVTDNQQIQVTIANANVTAAGSNTSSTFSAFSNVVSSTTGDRNRIEVSADRLIYGTQPSNTVANSNMSPFTLRFVDVNNNLDFDSNRSVTLSPSDGGVNMTSSASYTLTAPHSGIITASDVQFTTGPQTQISITASTTGLVIENTVVSNLFDVSDFTFVAGDMRPLYSTNLSFNGQWEYYDGSNWISSGSYDGKGPQNTVNTVNRVLITDYVMGGGTETKTYNCDFIVFGGGTLYIDDDITTPTATFISSGKKLEVHSGGVLIIEGDIIVNSNGQIILKDGANMTLNQASIHYNHPIWYGTENFENNSTVNITNWNFTGSGSGSLINGASTPTIHGNTNGYIFGNLIVDINPGNSWSLVGGGLGVVNLCENNFDISNASTNYIHGATNKTGTNGFVVNGNMNIYDGPFSFGTSFSTDSFNHQFTVNGNFTCESNDALKLHHNSSIPSALNGNVTVKGDFKVGPGVTFSNDGSSGTVTRMALNLDGGTLVSPKLINIASVATTIPVNIKANSARRLSENDLVTNSVSSFTTTINLESGASLDFGWDTDNTTPLVIKKTTTSPAGTNQFASQSNSTMIITSLDGLASSTGTAGNVQYTTSNRSFDQTATFWYVGKNNQITGEAFTTGTTAKNIWVDLLDNTKTLTLSSSTALSSPGILDIRKGKFSEGILSQITGSSGVNGGLLKMASGTTYSIGSTSSNTSDVIPRMNNTSTEYDLAATSTIELNAAGNQTLRGGKPYKNLTFSNTGTKTLSSAVTSMEGTILVQNAAIVNVENKTLGNTTATLVNLTMLDFSEYITAGTGTKPDAAGTYSLASGSKITFNNNAAVTMETIRLEPVYANVEIAGTNIGNGSTITGIHFQSGGTFTVKDGAVFKLNNTAGFNGSTATAIDNTNNPTITFEANSTVEYAGANQSITHFAPNYAILKISGTGIKTLANATETKVGEDLLLTAATLTIDNSQALTVVNKVNTTGGTLEIQNTGSLVQVNDVANQLTTGINKALKVTKPYMEYDYIYWSSPMDNETFSSVFAVNNQSYIYENVAQNYADQSPVDGFDDNGDDWQAPSTSTLTPGRGYIVLGEGSDIPFVPNGTSPFESFATGQSVAFDSGKFNNGTIAYLMKQDAWTTDTSINQNLIGNPYPSVLDLKAFYEDTIDTDADTKYNNNILNGTFYFWTHHTGVGGGTNVGPDAYNYNNADFATYNAASDVSNASSSGGVGPGRYVPSGQAFIAEATTPEYNVYFRNAMRTKDEANSSVYKIADFNKDIVKLKLTNENDMYRQTTIVFMDGAVDSEIENFDSRKMIVSNETDLYSLVQTNPTQLAIQGLSVFNDNKIIPLGVQIKTNGNYAIALDELEGIFNQGQSIYLEDTYQDIIHDLGTSPYTFTQSAGTNINDRFILRFTNSALGNEETAFNQVKVYPNPSTGIFNIAYYGSETLQYTIYDLTGKTVMSGTGNTINLSQQAIGLYVAKITDGTAVQTLKLVRE